MKVPCETLILISGKKQNGKDTLGGFLEEYLRSKEHKYGFLAVDTFAFADTLKETAKTLFTFSDYQLYTQEGKEKIDERYNKTPRVILQEFGTYMRNIYNNIWVDNTFWKIYNTLDEERLVRNFHCCGIITDCRYKNEIERIKCLSDIYTPNMRVLKFRINRPSLPNNDLHISEIDLDDYQEWDEIIINDGILSDLDNKAKVIVDKYF